MTRTPALSALVVALTLAAVGPAVASSVGDEGGSQNEAAPQRDRPIPWYWPHVTRDGRTLRIVSFSGITPPKKVVVRERARSVTVTVFEFGGPLPEGSPPSSDIGVRRCVKLRLRSALGERRVVDGRTGRERRVERDRYTVPADGPRCQKLPTVRR